MTLSNPSRTRRLFGPLLVAAMGLLLAGCSEPTPMPFDKLDGRWAVLGAGCDDSPVFLDARDGIVQRVARYEPASEFLFRYKDVTFTPGKGEDVRPEEGSVKFLANKAYDGSSDWLAWGFRYFSDGRLRLTMIDGKEQPEGGELTEDQRHYSLRRCKQ